MGFVLLILVEALAWIYYCAPELLKKGGARALGALIALSGSRRAVVEQNLEIAFPGDENRVRRAELFKGAYRHLGRVILDVMMVVGASGPMKRFARRRARLQGVEHWKKAKSQGKGVIMLSSHVGNWEIMAAGGAMHGAIDILLVTKKLKPEWLHDAIERGRQSCGVRATYEPKTLRDVLAHLKANGTVGMILDQYVGPPVGVRVEVFGTPVGTTAAVATLAKRTGAVVLPVVNHLDASGVWRIEIRPAIDWAAGDAGPRELAENTARYAQLLEKDIYAHPDQWLWTHRRFKGDLSPLRPKEWDQGRPRR